MTYWDVYSNQYTPSPYTQPRVGIYSVAKMLSYESVSDTLEQYAETDPRFVHPIYRTSGNTTLEDHYKKQAELRKRNLELWGRPDDPRLDPTSDMYDPLKLVYKDVDVDSGKL